MGEPEGRNPSIHEAEWPKAGKMRVLGTATGFGEQHSASGAGLAHRERGCAGVQQRWLGTRASLWGCRHLQTPREQLPRQLGELQPDQLLHSAGKGAKVDRLSCDKRIFGTFKLNMLSRLIQSGPKLPDTPAQPHTARAPVAITRWALALLATK